MKARRQWKNIFLFNIKEKMSAQNLHPKNYLKKLKIKIFLKHTLGKFIGR